MPAPKRRLPSKKVVKRRSISGKSATKLLKVRNSFKLAALLLISVFLMAGLFTLNRLDMRLVSADSTAAKLSYPDFTTIAYIVVDSFDKEPPLVTGIEYKIIDYKSKRVQSFNLNPNMDVIVSSKYDFMPISKIFAVGGLNGKDAQEKVAGGTDLVISTLFNLFEFPVEHFIVTNSENSYIWNSALDEGMSLSFFWKYMDNFNDKKDYTNFSISELYDLMSFIGSLPDDRRFSYQVSSHESISSMTSNLFADLTINSAFAEEAKSISVLNATDISGLAGFGSRVITNLGGRVVSVKNAQTQFAENFIVTDEPDSISVLTLMEVFDISKVVDKQSAGKAVNDTELYRSDIILILTK